MVRPGCTLRGFGEWRQGPVVEAHHASHTPRQNNLPALPELVGVAEVAELLEVTRQRASALARSRRSHSRW